MSQSLLQGKRFFCREWVFHKLQHCLQEKNNGKAFGTSNPGGNTEPSGKNSGGIGGILVVGGPGSGKTALCTELVWPTCPQLVQRGLHRQTLAFHFCKAQDADTLCVGNFIRSLVSQIRKSSLVQGYEEKLRDPAVHGVLQAGECERNPGEAFKRYDSAHQEQSLTSVGATMYLLCVVQSIFI